MPPGGNSRYRGPKLPRMSERQQLALLLRLYPQSLSPTNDTSNTQPSTSQSQRGSKGRLNNKNGDINRKDDIKTRSTLGNGLESRDSGSNSEQITNSDSSYSEGNSSTVLSTEQDQSGKNQQHNQKDNQNQQQRSTGSAAALTPTAAEDSGALCEMRRTPPQNKVDRSATGQSGSSPRVTLRLNQVRGARDEKKSANARQGVSGSTQGQMDTTKSSSSTTSSSPATSTASSGGSTTPGNTSAPDSTDVYEFKTSKEATPVRGSSPNPSGDKDKDVGKTGQAQGSNNSPGNSNPSSSNTSDSGANTNASIATGATENQTTGSPAPKRTHENDTNDEQDDENRRKKRKEVEPKDGTKNSNSGRASTGRASGGTEKCAKSGKQNANVTTGKSSQTSSTTNADRKSPSTPTASSPKPSNNTTGNNSKTATPAPTESDGEDERPKSSESGSGPKVPPLKIVIPQSTASEQEQGTRNGKNPSARGHQLPYVVPSSNSNDASDKDSGQTANGGTTSPTEAGSSSKTEDKKEFSTTNTEERSTHHQRVLRSSHRSGNGGNGSAASKDSSSNQSNNGNFSNSSPLPSTSTDRSNNPSPQQRHNSPTPETTSTESSKPTTTESTTTNSSSKSSSGNEKSEKNNEKAEKNSKDSDNSENSSTTSTPSTNVTTTAPTVELHPRKRKIKSNKESQAAAATATTNDINESNNAGPEVHPHDQPITNCCQLFLNIRKQIERRRKGLFPVQPKPPQGFKDYLMNRCTYVLASNTSNEPTVNFPVTLPSSMKDLYIEQEKERYKLRMQHVVEKEKLVLSVEQEILRVHGRAARALANQSLPFSVCTILKDEEVYNVITPEQEEKDRNARSRYNGRLFLSWLQDVDDKWEKIKESMLLRHHNEAESLHAVQKMNWEWKLKEEGLCEFKATPQIEDIHVPIVHVSDDFDLLPA
ncbi:ankyrin repeat domain-containing protein 12 isoform X2 [Chelonus insularis]|uniref:ankyrin repeat domain-containing protein 12 isoform X2 n=1 Tax=Chelonus insularis TaxID=460826 RepID=UPI00158985E0|nr:ankyrin repeat domain-containing protein 12 isoform X2 [Chelonus insularis]